ncbi:DUF998 domain-containing protein [Arthrobacter sp. M4]|uniref:DUF998 domain-containing protein n=1 Tax=Arthrobacter sp. M4 TaxID=218160 RepID=UPI001CDBC94F|nr:DUF998 domain-containing protein [Arthrobacter sp. M4]MCA4133843.1 DUF998 domain-containing protein [Arthrobacter sp. M4]
MSDRSAAPQASLERAGLIPDGLPDSASTRAYIGGWAQLSVVQYFVAESAVIEAWAGPVPYSRRTGFISDLGAINCGDYEGRAVCSPLHLLMNASFVVQGLGLFLGALLVSTALLCIAARPGVRPDPQRRKPWLGAAAVRILTAFAGAGTVIVGLVPEDLLSPWHLLGAVTFFVGGGTALLVLGILWLRHTGMSWFIGVCGVVTLVALAVGGLTAMHVPEPGTLERLMAYPVTIGYSAAGLVIAQRVRSRRAELRHARASG